MSEPDDTKLMERCNNGDPQAFEMLLARYEKPVFNAAYRMLNSPDDARDVTQTVFLKVFEHLDQVLIGRSGLPQSLQLNETRSEMCLGSHWAHRIVA